MSEYSLPSVKYAHQLAKKMDGTLILVNVFNERDVRAIQYALDKAGIESPNISTNVSLMVDQETTNRLSRAFKPQEKDDGRGNKDEMAADVEQIE